jgi:hypothetical protein
MIFWQDIGAYLVDPEAPGDSLGRPFVVACRHDDPETKLVKLLQSLGR